MVVLGEAHPPYRKEPPTLGYHPLVPLGAGVVSFRGAGAVVHHPVAAVASSREGAVYQREGAVDPYRAVVVQMKLPPCRVEAGLDLHRTPSRAALVEAAQALTSS